jgi:hypothetical protein
MTKVANIGFYDIVNATTLEANKSHSCNRSTAPAPSGCGQASMWY